MPNLWEDLKDKVKQGFDVAAEKTKEYAKIGELKVEIHNLGRDLDKTHRSLGEEVYAYLKKTKSSPLSEKAQVKKLLKEVDDIKKNIKAKEEEIEKVKKEAEKDQKNKETPKQQTKTNKKETSGKTAATKTKPKKTAPKKKASTQKKTV